MRGVLWAIILVTAGCSDRIAAPVVPSAASFGEVKTVFVATNRTETETGAFGIGRTEELTLLQVDVSVPKDRAPGTISDGQDKPKPGRDFALTSRTVLANDTAYTHSLRSALTSTGSGDITFYVHGFNNSFTDAAFRMAQLSHDLEINGPVVSFSWPSRGNPLGYQYDLDSTFYSRDALARTLRATANVRSSKIILVGHSMGSQLILETLRQLEFKEPGWSARNLSGVLLISPDVNVDVFRSQTAAFKTWPQPFVIFSSKKDILLRLSGHLRGDDKQLGALENTDDIRDLPVVLLDVSAFQDGDEANHFIAATSEEFLHLVKASSQLDSDFLEGHGRQLDSFLGSRRVTGGATTLRLTPESQ